ncbi:MAG TPA: DevR family CRISPR-associated autoregulator [Chloroflexota bacterium]|nr:DevR family CRISPR-associated autoregulator [Chloroflexota bacterium]
MVVVSSLALSARVTLNLHNLNNEGTEGNQQQTRMVHILDENGQRQVVNAISGDMFKHMLVDELTPLLREAGQPLSPGAAIHDPDRINANNLEFVKFCEDKKNSDSAVMTKMLQDCSVTDLAGALVTRGRAVGRKSVAEIGWVVGLPDSTVTEQYFHVKYAPEGRGQAAGGDTVAGQQAIFHRPASSGEYALICSLDLWRIGLNDITRDLVLADSDRTARARMLIRALAAILMKPSGAQRNTQAPHIMGCEGVVSLSSNSLPAPTVSPLVSSYRDQIRAAAAASNRLRPGTIEIRPFDSLADGVGVLADVAESMELPDVPNHA